MEAIDRTAGIISMASAFTEVERLRLIGVGISQQIGETKAKLAVLNEELSTLEAAERENKGKIVFTTQWVDGTLKELYGSGTAEEPKKRSRKTKEVQEEQKTAGDATTVQEVQEQQPDSPAVCINKECLDHRPELQSGCKVGEDVRGCGEAVIKETANTQATVGPETEGAETAAPGGEDPPGDGASAEEVQVVEEVTAQELAELQAGTERQSIVFTPLDEPIGECELCMGYGVVEGELYGEPTLVPCNCAAGQKVNSIATGKGACNDCNIADPDCADYHLPDMNAASPIELPTEEQARRDRYCGAWRDRCEPETADKCFAGVGCALLCTKGKPIGERQGVIPPAKPEEKPVQEQPKTEPENQKPANVKECKHPKVLRRKTPEGEFCKVCGQPVGGEQQSSMFGDAA